MKILRIEDLSVEVGTSNEPTKAVRGVSFTLKENEVFAIVGESGSGKSMLCKSIMHLLPKSGKITGGSIEYLGEDITRISDKNMCKFRGSDFAMVLQDPMTSLDPTYTVGKQIAEAIKLHNRNITKNQLKNRVLELMNLVGIEEAENRMNLYPYNLSGGMRQRCVLAIALASNPKVLIADEPTTALDVTIQAEILKLLKKIQRSLHTATIFISHDLAVVAQVADRVAIMYQGVFVEEGNITDVFTNPKHDYTKHLLNDRPSEQRNDYVMDKTAGTLLEIRNLTHSFSLSKKTRVMAVDDVSLALKRGEILGIVGESGSGKSTLARCVMNIYPSSKGEIIFDGVHTEDRMDFKKNKKLLQTQRQMIFQDSFSSLNPRMRIEDIITEPLKINDIKPDCGNLKKEAENQLSFVGMDSSFLSKYPSELSGGQRQRVAIARALTMRPALLIADEPVASLDVTTQSQIINLFKQCREEYGVSILFIAHDLMLVRSICDRVGVMYQGKLVELTSSQQLFDKPQNSYTMELLSAIPRIENIVNGDKE